jgi:hypothetical protein
MLAVFLLARSLPGAAEPAVVTVRGKVAGGGPVRLDEAAIMALPAATFNSIDPWDRKEHSFTGPLLSDALARAGIDKAATRITVTAKNGYAIPIRRSDYEKYGYLLALKMDGQRFRDQASTANRGLAIIAIDFAKHRELDPELYKHHLVWQVADILVE